jgi:hypothetical protein
MRTFTFVILFSVLTVVPSYAYSGNEWLADCNDEKSGFKQGFCLGFLRALNESEIFSNDEHIDIYIEIDGKPHLKPKHCMPVEKMTMGQLKKIVDKYLNEHPEVLHERFYVLHHVIMRETFPCNENKTP